MSRWWTERAANLFDAVGDFFNSLFTMLGHLLGLVPWTYVLLGLLALFVLWLLYRIIRSFSGRPKRARKAKKKQEKKKASDDKDPADAEEDAEPAIEADEVPDLPAVVFASLADRYAAEGRYAEAVRERLRAMVRRMVEAGVITNTPGYTVTELAAQAAVARPAVGPAVHEASRIFSDIWYGERPALAHHDSRMKELSSLVERTTVARLEVAAR